MDSTARAALLPLLETMLSSGGDKVETPKSTTLTRSKPSHVSFSWPLTPYKTLEINCRNSSRSTLPKPTPFSSEGLKNRYLRGLNKYVRAEVKNLGKEFPRTAHSSQSWRNVSKESVEATPAQGQSNRKHLPHDCCSSCEAKKLRREGALPLTSYLSSMGCQSLLFPCFILADHQRSVASVKFSVT